jgi:hypothetical protein
MTGSFIRWGDLQHVVTIAPTALATEKLSIGNTTKTVSGVGLSEIATSQALVFVTKGAFLVLPCSNTVCSALIHTAWVSGGTSVRSG